MDKCFEVGDVVHFLQKRKGMMLNAVVAEVSVTDDGEIYYTLSHKGWMYKVASHLVREGHY